MTPFDDLVRLLILVSALTETGCGALLAYAVHARRQLGRQAEAAINQALRLQQVEAECAAAIARADNADALVRVLQAKRAELAEAREDAS